MFFSSKITSSTLSYLDLEGISHDLINSHSQWTEEFLKEPSNWLEANKLESLLKLLEPEIGDFYKLSLLSYKLQAWGPLDSVLKLMTHPRDIYIQPERLLSYFISPAPPVEVIEKNNEMITFKLPISSEEYRLSF